MKSDHSRIIGALATRYARSVDVALYSHEDLFQEGQLAATRAGSNELNGTALTTTYIHEAVENRFKEIIRSTRAAKRSADVIPLDVLPHRIVSNRSAEDEAVALVRALEVARSLNIVERQILGVYLGAVGDQQARPTASNIAAWLNVPCSTVAKSSASLKRKFRTALSGT